MQSGQREPLYLSALELSFVYLNIAFIFPLSRLLSTLNNPSSFSLSSENVFQIILLVLQWAKWRLLSIQMWCPSPDTVSQLWPYCKVKCKNSIMCLSDDTPVYAYPQVSGVCFGFVFFTTLNVALLTNVLLWPMTPTPLNHFWQNCYLLAFSNWSSEDWAFPTDMFIFRSCNIRFILNSSSDTCNLSS